MKIFLGKRQVDHLCRKSAVDARNGAREATVATHMSHGNLPYITTNFFLA